MDAISDAVPGKRHFELPTFFKPACYFLAIFLSFVYALHSEMDAKKLRYIEKTHDIYHHINSKALANEVALESFKSFLSLHTYTDIDHIRAFVKGLRNMYPDLYMFEIASKVDFAYLGSFESKMARQGYPDFHVHGFDYDGGRSILNVPPKQSYYPIHFIEPETPETVDVLGLDLETTSLSLLEPMLNSKHLPHAIATRPFELLEGGKGYVIYSYLKMPSIDKLSTESFAMLVIRAADLIPDKDIDSVKINLVYRDANSSSFEESLIDNHMEEGYLIIDRFLDGALFLPRYSHEKLLSSNSQPFLLKFEKQLLWSDLDVVRILSTAIFLLLLFQFSFTVLMRLYGKYVTDTKLQHHLYQKANYDALTGLPNINLFIDIAEKAKAQADRHYARLAFCFLDLDKFKPMNDTYGHQFGDDVLKEVGNRLMHNFRGGDVAARIHGDEFIVMLSDLDDEMTRDSIVHRIEACFELPFHIQGTELDVRASVGISIYPEEGRDLEELINLSDLRMYEDKELHTGGTGVL